MDEPFGAVDPVGRRRLQGEFRRIQQELGTTVMLVTHDVDEAVRLADRVAVLSRGGRLEQLSDPVRLLAAPASAAVADLVGTGAGVRLLALGAVERRDLRPAGGAPAADASTLRVGDPLDAAFAALAAEPSGRVPVRDGGAVVGELDAAGLLAALHRLVDDAQERGPAVAEPEPSAGARG
jgi:osmoprotectant transport system ATP-binding protein